MSASRLKSKNIHTEFFLGWFSYFFDKVWDDGGKFFSVISVHHQEKTLLELIIIMISLQKEN